MIQEAYVSYEVAKLLKEKGFMMNPDISHWNISPDGTMYWVSHIGAYSSNPNSETAYYLPKDSCPCPTQQMAMRYLREVHKVHIIAEPCLGSDDKSENLDFDRWFWTILKEEGEYKPIRRIDEYPSYEKAVEAAIKYCLENLI